ncbi:MAG: TldD/PmbA family protein [Bacteroidota bacterium]|nr:TldD/PmbA family protein [Bacteroidota bacterium]
MIHDKAHYFNLFCVEKPMLEKLVATGLGSGGDWCDLFFENTTYGQFSLRDGAVTSGGLHADYGVGIRVLSGEKTGYAYSETTRPEDMLAAAKAASAITRGVVPVATVTEKTVASRRLYSGEPNPAADRYPVRIPWRSSDPSVMVSFLERLEAAIRARDTRIVKVMASLAWQVTDVLLFNSLGELKYDTRPLASVTATVIFEQNGRRERQTVSKSWRMGVEMLSDRLIAEMADEAVHGVDALFEAGRPKGGKMPVVMAAGASGILLHEAMGHAFEADFNRKGQSVFSDKMGKQICGKGISILDDATIPACRGSLNYDDEGVPGQKTYMVEDGVLTSYLHDRISARCYGVAPTGNGRRESFRYAPIPRMRATYMDGGAYSPEEILASVKQGIYVEQFANGQVKIGEGDFTFFVKSGFLIENGRLTRPVKDINIIGNGPEALADITMVGNDPRVDDGAWTCGKEQSAPVSCGIPTVLVKSLTVGGE